MSRRLISSGSSFESMTISSDVGEQAEQCFRNIAAALGEAGASLADVVRVHYIVPHSADFERCWPVLRKHFGEVGPAATMFCAPLVDPRIRIEIEVTARKRG